MKKDSIIIILTVTAIAIGVTSIVTSEFQTNPIPIDIPRSNDYGYPDAIYSGPLTLTKPQYKIYENIFFIIGDLKEDEKGAIRFFVPDGRLYKTVEYDGAKKSSSSLYFRPDTSIVTRFCTQDEFVGEWTIAFDNDAYPPLKFEILNEHLLGPGNKLGKAC